MDKLNDLLKEYSQDITVGDLDSLKVLRGFIQRLAKHFKLNISKIDARIALSDFNATDRMLMALAISEDPITLLVDCLK